MQTQVLIFLGVFCLSNVQLLKPNSNLELFVINSILKSQLTGPSGKIDFVSCELNSGLSTKILQHSLFGKSDFLSIKVKSCSPRKIELEASTILIFNSTRQFNEIYPKVSWKTNKQRSYRHLFLIANATGHEFINNVNAWHIDNTAFLMNQDKVSNKSFSTDQSLLQGQDRVAQRRVLPEKVSKLSQLSYADWNC